MNVTYVVQQSGLSPYKVIRKTYRDDGSLMFTTDMAYLHNKRTAKMVAKFYNSKKNVKENDRQEKI